VFIGRLRKKIPSDMIKTVRGLGYRLSMDPEEA
jgi:two-component system OmpR family response regulator